MNFEDVRTNVMRDKWTLDDEVTMSGLRGDDAILDKPTGEEPDREQEGSVMPSSDERPKQPFPGMNKADIFNHTTAQDMRNQGMCSNKAGSGGGMKEGNILTDVSERSGCPRARDDDVQAEDGRTVGGDGDQPDYPGRRLGDSGEGQETPHRATQSPRPGRRGLAHR